MLAIHDADGFGAGIDADGRAETGAVGIPAVEGVGEHRGRFISPPPLV